MWFTSWLGKRQRSTPNVRSSAPARKRATYRPQLEALEDRRLPSQVGLTVTSLADSGAGTLRAAILTADAGSSSDKFTIGFTVTGTIDLQSPLPDLSNSIAIRGPGANSLTIEQAAGYSFSSAIVRVDAGETASLSGLTIANGNGGGIANNGILTVVNSAVVNNPDLIFFGEGGGILNTGTLTLSGSTVSGNSAMFGGGIINTSSGIGATLELTDSTVSGNTAQFGGGIYNSGTLTLSTSTVTGNAASANGGGIYNTGGTLTVDRSMVSNNTATGFDSGSFHFPGEGGGILNDGTMTVSGSTISGNSADLGGGIFSDGFPTTVRNCVFTGNSATQGGGVYFGISPGLLEVQGSIFSCNHASDSGGALYNLGTATLQESSLSKNTAGSAGGGIFNEASATLAVKDCTVLNNTAPSGADIYNLDALTLDDSTVGVIGP